MERPNFIDYAKVITMYLVIWGHYIPHQGMEMGDNPIWNVVHFINVFHMPLFFLLSGMLFKPNPTSLILKNTYEKLVKPYVLMSFICLLLGSLLLIAQQKLSLKLIATDIIGIITGGDGPFSASPFSGPLWFLYAIVIIRTLFAFVNSVKYNILLSCGVLIIAVLILCFGVSIPFRIDSAFIGYIFFMIGYYSKNFVIKQLQSASATILVLCTILGFAMVVFEVFTSDDFHSPQVLSINAIRFGRYPILYIPSAIGGCMSIVCISYLFSMFKLRIIKVLSNGMIVTLGFQCIIYKIIKNLYVPSYSIITCTMVSILVYFITYLLIIFVNRYCPIILGNRKLK